MHLRSLHRLRPLIPVFYHLIRKNNLSHDASLKILAIFVPIINVVLHELCRSGSTGYKGACDK